MKRVIVRFNLAKYCEYERFHQEVSPLVSHVNLSRFVPARDVNAAISRQKCRRSARNTSSRLCRCTSLNSTVARGASLFASTTQGIVTKTATTNSQAPCSRCEALQTLDLLVVRCSLLQTHMRTLRCTPLNPPQVTICHR